MKTHIKAATFAPKTPQTQIKTTFQRHSISNKFTEKTFKSPNLLRRRETVLLQPSLNFKQEQKSNINRINITSSSILPSIQAQSSQKMNYRAVNIVNSLSRNLKYQYKWGNRIWKERNINKYRRTRHYFGYKGKRKPKFKIFFDADNRPILADMVTRALKTSKFLSKPKSSFLGVGKEYTFTRVSDKKIELLKDIVNYKGKDALKSGKRGKNFKLERIKGTPFIGGIKPEDVKQGTIGDCWLMATLMAIAKANPNRIRNLIKTKDRERGLYEITIFVNKNKQKKRKSILVNDKFPKGVKPPRAKFTGSGIEGNRELWVMLIEKAYAIHLGSYQRLKGGYSVKAMEALTGKQALTLNIQNIGQKNLGQNTGEIRNWTDKTPQSIANFIKKALERGYPLIASSSKDKVKGSTQKFKLLTTENHAYVIVAIDSSKITLRNPWGHTHPLPIPLDRFKNLFIRIEVGSI